MSIEEHGQTSTSEEPLDRRGFLTKLAAATAFAVPVVTTLIVAVCPGVIV